MASQYPDNFDDVLKKYDTVGYGKLNDREKSIYTIWWLEGEVNNGGFHQFFWNSAGDNTKDTLNFLTIIGATHTANLLRQASAIAFHGDAPSDRRRRQQLLDKNEAEKMEKLNALDDDFYQYHDDVTGLVNKHLEK